jgi:gamma-glutamyltranspeptidase/glutathione hydrolase
MDAAIAAAMLTVVYPHNVALGSDLIALVRSPGGDAVCVNASGWTGREGDVEALRPSTDQLHRFGDQIP